MYECIMKKFLLFCALFLFIATSSFGWDGPCLDSDACGGYWAGPNTCTGATFPECPGMCPDYCPGGDPAEYCEGWLGSCNERNAKCGDVVSWICGRHYSSCGCIEAGDSGYDCNRVDC